MKKHKQKTEGVGWQQAILEGRPFADPNLTLAPSDVIHFAKSVAGWKHVPPKDGGLLSTNGWQYDWWLEFRRGKKSFTAHGSGFYGGFSFGETEK